MGSRAVSRCVTTPVGSGQTLLVTQPGQFMRERPAEPAVHADTISMAEARAFTQAALLARRALRRRIVRREHFGPELAQDGVWNMLLELLAARSDGSQLSIKCLWLSSGLPHSTSLRWINHLVARGYVTRSEDPADGRRQFIALGDPLAERIATFIEETEA